MREDPNPMESITEKGNLFIAYLLRFGRPLAFCQMVLRFLHPFVGRQVEGRCFGPDLGMAVS